MYFKKSKKIKNIFSLRMIGKILPIFISQSDYQRSISGSCATGKIIRLPFFGGDARFVLYINFFLLKFEKVIQPGDVNRKIEVA